MKDALRLVEHLSQETKAKKPLDSIFMKRQKCRVIPAKEPKKIYTIKKSDQIYEENKKMAFRYLFTLMDSDEDGLISGTKISISRLSQ